MGTGIKTALARIIFSLSLIFPRDSKRWIFIGWHIGSGMETFADNTKYLFLHVANNPELGIKPVWLARDRRLAALLRSRGYAAYYQHSLRGIFEALRAGTTAIDAFLQPENFRWTGRSRLVQLLHGKGMKKGGYASKPLRRQDRIFSPSPFVNEMLPPIFVQKTPVTVTGYPRTDIFFRDISGSDIGVHEQTAKLLQGNKYEKKFLYAPTFRRGIINFDLESKLNLSLLSSWLVETSSLLVISLHPKYREQARELSYANIHFLEDSDIYPLLPQFDALITDYSSLFSDFLLLDKPLVFYPFDLEAYEKTEGLSFDYEQYTPGVKVRTPQELHDALKAICAGDDPHATERQRICGLYHTYPDGRSSERIMQSLTPR